jgi:hypothetical protein
MPKDVGVGIGDWRQAELVEFVEFVGFVEFANDTGDSVETEWRHGRDSAEMSG